MLHQYPSYIIIVWINAHIISIVTSLFASNLIIYIQTNLLINGGLLGINSCISDVDDESSNKLVKAVKGTEYVPTYEDKDGDLMLVGDVPWK